MCLLFLRDESGATAVEYALLASVFALMVTAAYTLLGDSIADLYDNTASTITTATSGS